MLVEPDIDWSPTARQLVSKALREPQPVPLRVADEVGAHGGTRALQRGDSRETHTPDVRRQDTVAPRGRGRRGGPARKPRRSGCAAETPRDAGVGEPVEGRLARSWDGGNQI